jgi:hypothetical protein
MLDERGGIAPFGWAVACAGRGAGQVEDEIQALVTWSASAWKRHFPAERGYRVTVESPEGIARGVRMSVSRGDFEASLSIEHAVAGLRGAVSAAPSVRMFGQAQSLVARRAHELGERLAQRGRIVGGAAGLGMFLSLAWLMIGVNNPVYMLGGMLLVVALLLALMGGGTLGASVGERIAARHRDRARREIDRNPAMHADIRRWKAVSRQLSAQRAALAGHRRQPFRSEPNVLTMPPAA